MIFVVETPILKAACVSSGESPRFINIGTKIGAIIAHFAESTAINKFIKAIKKIKTMIRLITVSQTSFRKIEPFIESTSPIFEVLKRYVNWAAKNIKTKNPDSSEIVCSINFMASLLLFILLAPTP